jgi:hypothetical protein
MYALGNMVGQMDTPQAATYVNTHCWVPLEFYQLYPVLIHKSEGAYVLPADGTMRLKHVGAIEEWKINNIIKNWHICWLVLHMSRKFEFH